MLYEFLFQDNDTENSDTNSTNSTNSTNQEHDDIYEREQHIKQIINKIRFNYKHNDIPKKLSYLFEMIKNCFVECKKIINNLTELIKSYDLPLFNSLSLFDYGIFKSYKYGYNNQYFMHLCSILNKEFDTLSNIINRIFVLLVDIFFLRRILDKDYITDSIVCTGILHSCTFIHTLVKYFNFTITDAYYCSDNDLKRAESTIKNIELGHEMQKLFYPDNYVQCVKLSE